MSRLNDIIKAVRPGNASNVRVILLCLFAATTFWFFNALNENYSTTVKYPLQFVYNQESYIALDPLPEEVQINVTGLGWNLFRNSLGIKVDPLEIPLEQPAETKKIVAASIPGLISDQLDELQLNYVLTDTLFVNIDSKLTRKFKLSIDSAGINLLNNYRIISPIASNPDSVTLTGPSSVINSLKDTIWVSLPQTEIDENYQEDVSINIPNGGLIRRDPPTVNVTFEVEEFVKRELSVPLKIENTPDRAYITKDDVTVSFFVRASQSENIDPSTFTVVLDFKTMRAEDSTVRPVIQSVPDMVKDVELDTMRLKVQFNE